MGGRSRECASSAFPVPKLEDEVWADPGLRLRTSHVAHSPVTLSDLPGARAQRRLDCAGCRGFEDGRRRVKRQAEALVTVGAHRLGAQPHLAKCSSPTSTRRGLQGGGEERFVQWVSIRVRVRATRRGSIIKRDRLRHTPVKKTRRSRRNTRTRAAAISDCLYRSGGAGAKDFSPKRVQRARQRAMHAAWTKSVLLEIAALVGPYARGSWVRLELGEMRGSPVQRMRTCYR